MMQTPATITIAWRSVAADPPPALQTVFILYRSGWLVGILAAFHLGNPAGRWQLADGTAINAPEWWSEYQYL